MSRKVDEHVVEMRFNNSDFEKKASQSMSTLDKLKEKLNLNTSHEGIDNLTSKLNVLNKTDLSGINKSVNVLDVSLKAIAKNKVFTDIANTVVSGCKKITNALDAPIKQIINGGKARAKNIENAKFQLNGLGIAWEDISDDINYGVKDTAYGLDSAAKAASQFVASGVQLGTQMRTALRGISGVAAMTNSSYDEIANIFTTISGNGRLMTMQLNQLAGRGLNVAATLAKSFGVTESELREMVSKGKVSFDDFSRAMDEAFGDHAKEANKTFDGALSNTKAALSRLGADVASSGFEALRRILVNTIPVLNQFKSSLAPLIDPVDGVITQGLLKLADAVSYGVFRLKDIFANSKFGDFIRSVADALNKLITLLGSKAKRVLEEFRYAILDFLDADGLPKIVQMFRNIYELLNQPLRALVRGFISAFNGAIAPSIVGVIDYITKLSRNLWLSYKAQNALTKIGYVFGKVIRTLGQILLGVAKVFGSTTLGLSQFRIEIGNLFDLLQLKSKDTIFEKIFNNKILNTIRTEFPIAIQNLVDAFTILKGKVTGVFGKVKVNTRYIASMKKVQDVIDKLTEKFTDFIKKVSESTALKDFFGNINIDNVSESLVDIIEFLSNSIEKVGTFFGVFGEGTEEVNNLTGSVKGLTGVLDLIGKTTGIKELGSSENKAALGKLSDTITNIKEVVDGFLFTITEAITKLASGINWAAVVAESFGIIAMVTIYRFGQMAQGIQLASGKIGSFFSKLSDTVSGVKKIKVSGFVAVSAAIIGLIFALIKLAKTDAEYHDNLMMACAVFGVIGAALTALYIATLKLDKMGQSFEGISQTVATIIKYVSFILLSLAALSYTYGALLSQENGLGAIILSLFSFIIVIGLIGAIITGLVYFGNEAKVAIKGAAFILAIGVALLAIAGSLILISKYTDPTTIKQAMRGIVEIILAIGILGFLVKDVGLKAVFSILIFSSLLAVIGLELVYLTNLPWDEITSKGLFPIMTVFGILTIMVAVMMKITNQGEGLLKAGVGILALAASIVLIGLALNLLMYLEIDKSIFPKIGLAIGVLSLMGGIALAMSLAIKDFKSDDIDPTPVIALLVGLAGMLAVLTVVFKVLDTIDNPKTVLLASAALIIAMAGIAGMIMAFAYLAKVAEKDSWTSIVSVSLMVSSIVGLITSTLAVLSNVDYENTIGAATGLGIVFATLALLISQIAKIDSKQARSISLAVLAISSALFIMAAAAIALVFAANSITNGGTFAGVVTAMVITMGGLIGALYFLGKHFNSKAKVRNLLLVASSFAILSGVMVVMAMSMVALAVAANMIPSGTGFYDAFLLMYIEMASLILALGIFGKTFDSKAKIRNLLLVASSFAILAGIMVVMAGAMIGLAIAANMIPSGSAFSSIMSAVVASMLGLIVALYLLGKEFNSKAKVKNLLLVASSFAILSGVMAVLGFSMMLFAAAAKTITDSKVAFGEIMATLAYVFAALIAATYLITSMGDPKNFLIAAAGMAILAGVFILLGFAMNLLAIAANSIESDKLDNFINVMAVAAAGVAIMTGLTFLLASLGEKAFIGVAAVAALVVCFGAFGVAAILASVGINCLVPAMQSLANCDFVYLVSNSAMIFASALLLTLAGGLLPLAGLGFVIFGLEMLALSKMLKVISGDFVVFVENLTKLEDALVVFFNKTVGIGSTMANKFVEGVNKTLKSGNIFSAGLNVAKQFLNGLMGKDGLDEHSPSEKTDEAGVYAVEGFENGLNSYNGDFGSIGEGMANDYLSGLYSNTPSAEQFMSDFNLDSFSNMDMSTMDFGSIGSSGGMFEDLKGSLNFTDMFDPSSFDLGSFLGSNMGMSDEDRTITPILNTDGLKGGLTDKLKGLFSGNSMKIEGTVDAIIQDQKDYTSELTLMKNELSYMKQSVDKLGDKMDGLKNLKVQLNGRALVGELAPDVTNAVSNQIWRNNRLSGNVSGRR